jgi:hypothetical protein
VNGKRLRREVAIDVIRFDSEEERHMPSQRKAQDIDMAALPR